MFQWFFQIYRLGAIVLSLMLSIAVVFSSGKTILAEVDLHVISLKNNTSKNVYVAV